ncbi:hypothetical protein EV126DRAFT_417727, partial [Verticillium dahliae]
MTLVFGPMLYLVFLSMRWKTLLYLALVDPDTTHLIANVTLDDALAYGKNIECGFRRLSKVWQMWKEASTCRESQRKVPNLGCLVLSPQELLETIYIFEHCFTDL